MNFFAFRESLSRQEPPAELTKTLVGLWWDARGEWTRGASGRAGRVDARGEWTRGASGRARESAQDDESPAGAWVHAYLHRKEGDALNAAYWYHRAGKPVARISFEEEWTQIATALLKES